MTPTENSPGWADPRADGAGVGAMQLALALDRTTLAWVRTTLTFATFGFGLVAFFRGMVQVTHTEQAVRLHQAAIRTGVALIIIGIVATIFSAGSHWLVLRRLRRGELPAVSQWPLTITTAVVVAVLGLYALWSVFAP